LVPTWMTLALCLRTHREELLQDIARGTFRDRRRILLLDREQRPLTVDLPDHIRVNKSFHTSKVRLREMTTAMLKKNENSRPKLTRLPRLARPLPGEAERPIRTRS